jgi:hypothetical protein
MHKFTSNIPAIFNDTCTMQDASAHNLDLSGNLDVVGDLTVGGTLSVTEATTLGGTLSVAGVTTLSGAINANGGMAGDNFEVADGTGNTSIGGTLGVTGVTTLTGSLNANGGITGDNFVVADGTGNTSIGGTLGVTNTSTLTGNVGIGGASGSHKLLMSGSERETGNLDVSGDLVVTGSFNFSEVIQNITTVNNEVIISTQLDISNQGTGPALKVSQFGVGEDQDVALFNAGDESDAFKIDYAGNSYFYKPVEMDGNLDVSGTATVCSLNVTGGSFDTILIRRTDAVGQYITLRNLQVYVDNINILQDATNDTTSTGSGGLSDVIEFMTWNNLVARSPFDGTGYASNIRNHEIILSVPVFSNNAPYTSLYIPLTQSFNISDVQSFVLYNRLGTEGQISRINGLQIELYNRSNDFTPGSNVVYTMPITTTSFVYRYDLPSISTYSLGFSFADSQTLIKNIAVSDSSQNFMLMKAEGENVEIGGDLSVSGVINQTGAMWSRGGSSYSEIVSSGQYITHSVIDVFPEVNCVYNLNGTITIQKAGRYLVAYSCTSIDNGDSIEVHIMKNGSYILKGLQRPTGNKLVSQTTITFLNVNDTIGLYLNVGTLTESVALRNFSGYLIG